MAAGRAPKFSPGEMMNEQDENDIVTMATQRAWETPDYSHVLGLYRILQVSYGLAFGANANVYGEKIAWTKGNGLVMSKSTLTLSIDAGFVGKYMSSSPPAVLDLPAGTAAPRMRWGYILNGEQSNVFAAASAGKEYYALVEMDMVQTIQSDTRHFEDDATGVKSSQSVEKRITHTPTFYYTTFGAEANPGSALPPALTAGRALVAMVLISETQIEKIIDCTIPWGPACVWSAPPARSYSHTVGFAPEDSGPMKAAANGDIVVIPCPFPGDSSCRILGVQIRHDLTNTSPAKIESIQYGYDAGSALINTLADSFPGGATTIFIPMVGSPIYAGYFPLWGHGTTQKDNTISPFQHAAIRITAGAVNDRVYGVSWMFVKG